MWRWDLRGRPDLLPEKEGDDLIHHHEMDDTSEVSRNFCISLCE